MYFRLIFSYMYLLCLKRCNKVLDFVQIINCEIIKFLDYSKVEDKRMDLNADQITFINHLFLINVDSRE
jgi:hypothetical protein